MLKLAGSVASRASCSGEPAIADGIAGRAALCRFPQKSCCVTLYEGIELGKIEQSVHRQMNGRVLDHRWQAGELRGRYLVGIGRKAGLLFFQSDGLGGPGC
ncbi:hypothetical protein ATK36_3964 [Amycolatopsis sulphurea]|uniref:Uncharacterized protein n=1 Tax=Amycolatopsis sulphurea TaxID=76022 RepID=A0A2A9FCF3_9PSEU|nr:hypothetical protein [Amycolatopsis sulphurea]PFG48848.1 hypothetical protein ATK36_3964 [Amycolatopsis sulphurea]